MNESDGQPLGECPEVPPFTWVSPLDLDDMFDNLLTNTAWWLCE